jgi:hypothetical protein
LSANSKRDAPPCNQNFITALPTMSPDQHLLCGFERKTGVC